MEPGRLLEAWEEVLPIGELHDHVGSFRLALRGLTVLGGAAPGFEAAE
jgi:hypothetical protein